MLLKEIMTPNPSASARKIRFRTPLGRCATLT